MKTYYEQYDEMLLENNNRGGRPRSLGAESWDGKGCEINDIREEISKRFHLGYCKCCGERIVIGKKRAEELVRVLYVQQGIRPRKIIVSWRMKIINILLLKWSEKAT